MDVHAFFAIFSDVERGLGLLLDGMLGLVFISLFCLLFPSIFSAILIDPRLLSKFYLLGYYFSMAQIKESVVKLNSTGKVALGSIATLANNLQYLKSIKDSGVFHQADYSTIQVC